MNKRGRKKMIALLLAAVCIAGQLDAPVTSYAQDVLQAEKESKGRPKYYTYGDWEYMINDDGTVYITDYIGETRANVAEIPAEIEGRAVTSFDTNFDPDGCLIINTLIIPETVTSFKRAHATCGGLKEIIVKEGNPVYRSVDGVVYDKQMKTLLWSPTFRRGTMTVPQGVEKIGENAFQSSRLSAILLPDSLREIGAEAFAHCFTHLTSLDIPQGVEKIGEGAFSWCDKLKTVRIPDSVKKIGKSAFLYSEKATIECSDKSYAQSYAQKNGIPYKIVKKVSAGKLGLTVNGQSVKDAQTLKVKVNKSYAVQAVRRGVKEEVKWKTSNAKVASVKNGKITVKKAGQAIITATASNGKKTRIKLSASKAAVRVSKVQVSGSKTMKKGSKQILGLTVTPATANSTKVSWKSSDKKIATVDKNGKIAAKKKGAVVITATAKDGSKKKGSIKIKVK